MIVDRAAVRKKAGLLNLCVFFSKVGANPNPLEG